MGVMAAGGEKKLSHSLLKECSSHGVVNEVATMRFKAKYSEENTKLV